MKRAAPFFPAAARASLPLWLWALHFAFCYVAVAVGCRAGWQHPGAAGLSPLQGLLGWGSAAALGGAVVLLVHAWRHRATAPGALLARVRSVVAALALIGIAWTSIPLLLLPTCRIT